MVSAVCATRGECKQLRRRVARFLFRDGLHRVSELPFALRELTAADENQGLF
jgi:hypothetical protein